VGKTMMELAILGIYNASNAEKWAIKGMTAQTFHKIKVKYQPQQSDQGPHLQDPEEDHLCLVVDSRLEILGTHRWVVKFTV